MRHKFIVQLQQDSGKKMAGGYRTRLSEKLNGISVDIMISRVALLASEIRIYSYRKSTILNFFEKKLMSIHNLVTLNAFRLRRDKFIGVKNAINGLQVFS